MPVFILLFLLLLLVYALLMQYYQRAWNNIPVFKTTHSIPVTSISVIISARNEEKNIESLLYSLEQQSYPKNLFELIIVDDYSEDDTWNMLAQYQDPSFSTIFVKLSDHSPHEENIKSHKKKAIETGIRLSRGGLIVTTDADCIFPVDWLQTLAYYYESTNAKFIAAPVKIAGNTSLLSIFQTLDFITLQGITGASVYKNIHSMCNGANLAYEKKAFEEVNGFEGIDTIPSGDDMLLMHKIYMKYPDNVFYLKSRDAIVTTAATVSWKAFFHQRIRWASKAGSYEDKRIFWVLLLVYLMNCCFLILSILSFYYPIAIFFLVLFAIAKLLIEFPFVHTVASFFRQQSLMKYFAFLQPLHILYTIIAGWLGKFGSFEWKGRRIKN